MKRILLTALAMGSALAAISPADAAQGCGAGWHRGYYGRCHPNYAPGPIAVAPGALVVGTYYPRRGYWDGRRYWWHREHWHGGWRYR